MARTTRTPTIVVVSDRKLGSVIWTPSSHAQKHLRNVPDDELQDVIALMELELRDHLRGVGRIVCDAVGHEAKKRTKALVDLEQAEPLVTGGLSNRDAPEGPFVHGVGV